MSHQILSRKPVTDLVLAALRATSFLVGDVNPPAIPAGNGAKAGWNGQPGSPGAYFEPYALLVPMTVSTTSGPVKDQHGDVQLPYQLSIYGIDRAQVELLADKLRRALLPLKRVTYTDQSEHYKIQQVWYATIGMVGRVDATDPATMGEVDVFNVWVTREVQ